MNGARQFLDSVPARSTPPVAAYPDRACAGVDPDVFFPKRGDSSRAAIKICRSCPHQDECLTWALDTQQGFGVWGGKTAEQRSRMRGTT